MSSCNRSLGKIGGFFYISNGRIVALGNLYQLFFNRFKAFTSQEDINRKKKQLVYIISNDQNLLFLKSLVQHQVESIAGDTHVLEVIESNNKAVLKIQAGEKGLLDILKIAQKHDLDIIVDEKRENKNKDLEKTKGLDAIAGVSGLSKILKKKHFTTASYDSGYQRYHHQFQRRFKKQVFQVAGYEGMSKVFKQHFNLGQ